MKWPLSHIRVQWLYEVFHLYPESLTEGCTVNLPTAIYILSKTILYLPLDSKTVNPFPSLCLLVSPEPPLNITTSFEEDFDFGELQHAILNVTWELPEG